MPSRKKEKSTASMRKEINFLLKNFKNTLSLNTPYPSTIKFTAKWKYHFSKKNIAKQCFKAVYGKIDPYHREN